MIINHLDELADVIQKVDHITVLTGAGISKSSGLPTFRDKGGLWADADLMKHFMIDALPESVPVLWDFWTDLTNILETAGPNPAHLCLAKLGKTKDVKIITQNVDRLHQVAGSRTVYELHGSVLDARCIDCNALKPIQNATHRVCDNCGGPLRPAMILFGEPIPEVTYYRAVQASTTCELFLAVGTSGTVFPACELVSLAHNNYAYTCLINAEEWEWPHPDFKQTILGKAEEILPLIIE